MTTAEVLKEFGQLGLSRDLLYYWEKRKWLASRKVKRGKSMQGRTYAPSEIAKINILLKCYEAGLTPEASYQIACKPELLRSRVLDQLVQATREIGESVILDNAHATLKITAKRLRELLQCESCSVLLPSGEGSKLFRVVAWSGDKAIEARQFASELSEEPKGDLFGYLAYDGKVKRLDADELQSLLLSSHTPSDHLESGQCYSLLIAPLTDRKGRTLGWIEAENRKGCAGKSSSAAFFDAADEAIAEVFANLAATMMECVRIAEASRHLMAIVPNTVSLPRCLEEILDQARLLVNADRGDVFWRDDERRQLLMAAQIGESKIKVGQALDGPSITGLVFKTRMAKLLPDVSAEANYSPCRDETRSEVAVPLLRSDDPLAEPLGVLNLEALSLNAFDDHDVDVLRYLAAYAALAAQIVESRDAIYRRIVEQMLERSLQPEEALHSFLESVHYGTGFDEGIIYIADYKKAVLRCSASLPRRPDARSFVYAFDQTCLAGKVLRDSAPYYSEEPWKDPNVAKEGLKFFDIQGPIVGVPLLFGPAVVGVLVVWSRKSRRPVPDDKATLAQYAKLAITTIAVSESERQRRDSFSFIRNVLAQMQKNEPLAEIIRTILKGVCRCGFDRARVFEFHDKNQAFVCLDSFGEEEPGRYSGIAIELQESIYARHTAEAARLQNVEPEVRNPGEMFGVDPSAERLGKPPDLPWAVAPLVIAGRPFGYIAADNVSSRREIGSSLREYLGLFGALAAQAIANEQSVKMLGEKTITETE